MIEHQRPLLAIELRDSAITNSREYGSTEPFLMRREIMRFLRRPAPRARPSVHHREALQKPCCTKPWAASRAYGDLIATRASVGWSGPPVGDVTRPARRRNACSPEWPDALARRLVTMCLAFPRQIDAGVVLRRDRRRGRSCH